MGRDPGHGAGPSSRTILSPATSDWRPRGNHGPGNGEGLGRARPGSLGLRAGAAGGHVVPPRERFAGAQGSGWPLELPRRLLRQPAPGLRAAVVPDAAARGGGSRGREAPVARLGHASPSPRSCGPDG